MTEETEAKLPENMTKEELEAYWKDLFHYFANPKCDKCYGKGWEKNLSLNKIEPCPKKRCAKMRLTSYMVMERQKQREEEKRKKEESNEPEANTG